MLFCNLHVLHEQFELNLAVNGTFLCFVFLL